MFDTEYDYAGDRELVLLLAAAGGCSLATTAEKDNWVDRAGSLPNYICKIAKEVKKSGKSTSSAIAIAVSRVKKWAAGGDGVEPDTVAKAAKAVAEWEALKAKNKSKKLALAARHDDSPYFMFSNVPSYNTELVRIAWNFENEKARLFNEPSLEDSPYSYIKELWSDHIIVETESRPYGLFKVPYEVSEDGEVSFGERIPVKSVYVEVDNFPLTPDALKALGSLTSTDTSVHNIINIAGRLKH